MFTQFIKKITRYLKGTKKRNSKLPIIIPRDKHILSRSQVNPFALKVLYRLHKAGFQAYLVGGCVRDLLLGYQPKDFDVATNASPEQVRQLFSNCRLIGRRFRLAHVYYGDEIIEVATFRGPSESTGQQHVHSAHGMILRDNVYGTLEQDAWRRDFSVNALYYNIADFSIVDYTGGLRDLLAREVRMIGDPAARFREDPVRILRAIRFAAKLHLRIEPKTAAAIPALVSLLEGVPAARLFDEILKLFHSGAAVQTYMLLQSYGIFGLFFPDTQTCIERDSTTEPLLLAVLKSTDQRIAEDKPVSAAFLFSALLWAPLCVRAQKLAQPDQKPIVAWMTAIDTLFQRQKGILIPNRMMQFIRDIWILEYRLTDRFPPSKLGGYADNLSFRAAYDFLLLRQACGEPVGDLPQWWLAFREANDTQREQMIQKLPVQKGPRRYKKRKSRGDA